MKNKKEVFANYGIEYANGKIYAPVFGWIPMLLVDGNAKLGKGIFTFSTLPTNKFFHVEIDGDIFEVQGTCPCTCVGCYATNGFYNMPSVLKANAMKTVLARLYPSFVKNAIIAQIKAFDIHFLRIHASGDFFSMEYVNMWKEICIECNTCIFWTYTKNRDAETAFDGIENANIVKSLIDGIGKNYGTCEHVLKAFHSLQKQGKKVYICRCGIDKNQHCTNCKGCSSNDYVLFLEHSTAYKAEKDELFPLVKEIIESQKSEER